MDFRFIQIILISFISVVTVVTGEMLQLSGNEIDMINVLKNISVATITACYMQCSKHELCTSIGLTRTSDEHLHTCHLLRKADGTVKKEGNKLAVVEVGKPNDNVDGKYTAWSSFGPCSSKVCGVNGRKERNRTCTNPTPEGNGNDCRNIGRSCEVRSCDPCKYMYFATTPHTFKGKELIGNISTWHKVFKVQFQLKINQSEIKKGMSHNVVRFETEFNKNVPVVVLACFAEHVQLNTLMDDESVRVKKENEYFKNWVKIDISQRLEGDKYMYRVAIDDKVERDVENTDARNFYDVKIFANAADSGVVLNEKIKSFRVEGAEGLTIPQQLIGNVEVEI